jgi:hypothetical protein
VSEMVRRKDDSRVRSGGPAPRAGLPLIDGPAHPGIICSATTFSISRGGVGWAPSLAGVVLRSFSYVARRRSGWPSPMPLIGCPVAYRLAPTAHLVV